MWKGGIMEVNRLTEQIIGAAIEVHRNLGPGLLERTYEACLAQELKLQRIQFEQQKRLAVNYKGITIDRGYRLDFLVEQKVVVEIKAIAQLLSIHDAQLLTYLKLGDYPVGLLLNFNVPVLKEGIRRKVFRLQE
jgi:GxxExxY protein